MKQKNKKKKGRVEVLQVADVRSYIVDERGNEYLCKGRLLQDLRKGHFVKVRVEEEGVMKILAIFG